MPKESSSAHKGLSSPTTILLGVSRPTRVQASLTKSAYHPIILTAVMMYQQCSRLRKNGQRLDSSMYGGDVGRSGRDRVRDPGNMIRKTAFASGLLYTITTTTREIKLGREALPLFHETSELPKYPLRGSYRVLDIQQWLQIMPAKASRFRTAFAT